MWERKGAREWEVRKGNHDVEQACSLSETVVWKGKWKGKGKGDGSAVNVSNIDMRAREGLVLSIKLHIPAVHSSFGARIR